jgi:hypothetical protein
MVRRNGNKAIKQGMEGKNAETVSIEGRKGRSSINGGIWKEGKAEAVSMAQWRGMEGRKGRSCINGRVWKKGKAEAVSIAGYGRKERQKLY